MPSQLLTRRLQRFYDEHHLNAVMRVPNSGGVADNPAPPHPASQANEPQQNTVDHWPSPSFGSPITSVQNVVIHETSGWPSYQSGKNFENLYLCHEVKHKWNPPQNGNPGFWTDNRGVGPQFYVDGNGTVFALIGTPSMGGNPLLTWHAEIMNLFSVGIENGDVGDDGPGHGDGLGPRWWRMSNAADDLTGMKLYLVLHPDNAEDAVLIWFAQFPQTWTAPVYDANGHVTHQGFWSARAGAGAPFGGSGDIFDGANPATDRRTAHHPNWKGMLFTERDYRSLAMLCKCIAETAGLPRNFLLLPYLERGDHSSSDSFRKLILADQAGETIATKLGLQLSDIRANNQAFTSAYAADTWDDRFGTGWRRMWTRFFGINPSFDAQHPHSTVHRYPSDLPAYRGFLSHSVNGDHPCPGPLFDWHRLAREVWDWWWYPFDFVAPLPTLSTTRRPYKQARKTTPLGEYYYDAVGQSTNYDALFANTAGGLPVAGEKYRISATTPVYALANGVLVAARIPDSSSVTNQPGSGFVLTRHEVFSANGNGIQTGPTNGPGDRINYDVAPTYVWTLVSFLTNAGFSTDQISDSNPDWLNRFLIRLKECELAVTFHTAATGAGAPAALTTLLGSTVNQASANALKTALTHGWTHAPTSPGPRSTTGEEIESDARRYRSLADDLKNHRVALFPLEKEASPTPVRIILGDFLGFADLMPQGPTGIQIEIFSKEKLDVPNAQSMQCAGSTEDWWQLVTAANRNESTVDADLPANSLMLHATAWHYTMKDFLAWVNEVTWASEWQKYNMPVMTPRPTRPNTRIVS